MNKALIYIKSILIPLLIGVIVGFTTSSYMNNSMLVQPNFAPPAILFPIVWTILFTLMGISAAMIYNNNSAARLERDSALLTYGISLILNFFWSIIFFNFRRFLFAFIWLLFLLFIIIRMIIDFRKIRPAAGYLQIPYAVWVTFAGYLNFGIWWLNR